MSITKTIKWLFIPVAAIFLTLPSTLLADDPVGFSFTPGFWKNDNSASHWEQTGFQKTDGFQAIFGVNTLFNSNTSLLDILNAKGGGADALGRHAVAAFLNASLPGSTYPYSPAEITSSVGAALTQHQINSLSLPGSSEDDSAIEDLKDIYEALNEDGPS